MAILNKIEAVLRDAGQPLHYAEITKRLLTSGAWVTSGKTPDATVNARIAEDIKHNPASRFVKEGKGIFALRPASAPVSVAARNDVSAVPAPAKAERRARRQTMSFLEAAAEILERFGHRKPR